MNGPVCTVQAAVFLTKVMINLVQKYNKLCLVNNVDGNSELERGLYKQAMVSTIEEHAVTDMLDFGCLLMLKERLASLIDSKDRLDIKTLSMF